MLVLLAVKLDEAVENGFNYDLTGPAGHSFCLN
jgi:hypothetical protein